MSTPHVSGSVAHNRKGFIFLHALRPSQASGTLVDRASTPCEIPSCPLTSVIMAKTSPVATASGQGSAVPPTWWSVAASPSDFTSPTFPSPTLSLFRAMPLSVSTLITGHVPSLSLHVPDQVPVSEAGSVRLRGLAFASESVDLSLVTPVASPAAYFMAWYPTGP